MKKFKDNWRNYPDARTQTIYLVWHGYKNQPTGIHVEAAFTRQSDALAYIKKDPNIGCEGQMFTLENQYAITVMDLRDYPIEEPEVKNG